MINYSISKEYSEKFLHFCILICLNNRKTYSILCDFLPFIPIRTLDFNLTAQRNIYRHYLRCPSSISANLTKFYHVDQSDEPLHINLGGDAASILFLLLILFFY